MSDTSTITPQALAAELAGSRQTNTVHAVKTGDAPTDLILMCLEAARSLGCHTQAAAEVFEYLARRLQHHLEMEEKSSRQWQEMAGGAAASGKWPPDPPITDPGCHHWYNQSSPSSPSPASTAALGSLLDGSTVSCGPLNPRP